MLHTSNYTTRLCGRFKVVWAHYFSYAGSFTWFYALAVIFVACLSLNFVINFNLDRSLSNLRYTHLTVVHW